MSQAEILQVMAKEPNRWFRSKDFKKIFNINFSTIGQCSKKLCKSGFTEKQKYVDGCGRGFEYRIKNDTAREQQALAEETSRAIQTSSGKAECQAERDSGSEETTASGFDATGSFEDGRV